MAVTLHTSLGDIKLELYCEIAPKSCENFLALCGRGYYDETIFHRNIQGFMMQGGDPTGTGRGGESIWGGKFNDELSSVLKHARGTVSWANSGPNTNGSQFFISYAKTKYLQAYTIFGHVIAGWETLDALEAVPSDDKDRPVREIKLVHVTIHANPLAEEQEE